MVGIDGQFLFKFRIQDREDFIDTEDLLSFKLCEAAGNVLPTFEMAFTTLDEKLLGLFHESNDIEVSFGRDRDSLTDIKLVPMRMVPSRVGANKHMLVANGFYSALGYLNTDRVFISNKLSGIEVIKQVASKYFSTSGVFNVDKGVDSMNWIQSAMPDRNFVNQMWMHSNLPNSFPAVGISSDGKFILKDIKVELAKDYRWRFTPKTVDAKRDIFYDGDATLDINTGFINNWVGYTREKTLYNLEAGDESILSNITKPIMSLTKEITKRVDIEKRYAQAGIQSDNVHPEYWSSYLRNLSSLATLAAVKNTVSFSDYYKPIRVLDLVMFKEDSTENPLEASEYKSGLHFVTKVARQLQNSKLTTIVELSRESMNSQKGEFLPVEPAPVIPAPVLTETETLINELKARFPGRFT